MSQYVELMNRIEVTEKMRQRILENLQKVDLIGTGTSKVLHFSTVKKWVAMAACFAILLVGAVTLPGLLSPTEPENPGTQVENGIVDVTSAEELSKAVGFPISDISGLPFTVQNQAYTAYWNEMAEITYTGDGQTAVYRISLGTDDNSGDYSTYASETELAVGSETVTLKGADDLYTLAVWTDGKFAYSLRLSSGETESTWNDLIQGIQPLS